MKKKYSICINPSFIIGVLLILAGSCRKDDAKPASNSVTDIDGNVYHTVTIGTQVWMAENLKVTKYNDGTPIPLVTDDLPWYFLKTAAYCWYNNDAANKYIYGALYNWFAVNTGKLAPAGWHVPTDAEWTTLTTYLGGEIQTSNKLRETGIAHWQSPNTGATNASGFTALPAGQRRSDNIFSGVFDTIGYSAYWWSSTHECCEVSWYRTVTPDNSFGLFRAAWNDYSGYSVRCLKD
jgi:uncharacterized protein (TIGR02145 family)